MIFTRKLHLPEGRDLRKVTLSGGKARFDLHPSSGDLYYYEEKQGRVITLRPDFGGWNAQVQPLK